MISFGPEITKEEVVIALAKKSKEFVKDNSSVFFPLCIARKDFASQAKFGIVCGKRINIEFLSNNCFNEKGFDAINGDGSAFKIVHHLIVDKKMEKRLQKEGILKNEQLVIKKEAKLDKQRFTEFFDENNK